MDPKPIHFVACGLLTVAVMAPVMWSIGLQSSESEGNDLGLIQLMGSPILFGFLSAFSLGWVTTIEYSRCIRASLICFAGTLLVYLLNCVGNGVLSALAFVSSFMYMFLGVLVMCGLFVVLGSSLGYWVSGWAWKIRRARLGRES